MNDRSNPLPTADDEAPDQIGPYRILSVIGEGGMGTVYAAEQKEPVERRVAVKVIKLGMDSRAVLARFEAERQALALMNHPNIARVLDAGTTARGQPYFAMEFVRGTPITEYCDRNRVDLRGRLALFGQVCRGVQHAHHNGIMHRDLKPTNILVEMQDGAPVAKIIDFGLARATNRRLTEKTLFTEQGQILGTPEYMSPEQAEMAGTDVDTRTDVYSLGVILYQLLVGELPFSARELREAGYFEIRRRIREDTPAKPSTRLTTLGADANAMAEHRSLDKAALARALKGDLDWITMRALEKDRQRRFQTAAELGADIERYLNDEPVSAGPPGLVYRLGKLVRRHRTPFVAALLVVLTLFAAAAVSTWQMVEAEEARGRAEAAKTSALTAQREAEAARANYDRLADLVRLEKLRQEADALGPEVPESVAGIESWMAAAGELERTLPEHRRALEELRGLAGQREPWRFTRAEDQFRHDRLADLVAGLTEFGAIIARVREGRDWALRITAETIESPSAKTRWEEAIEAIRVSTRYGGLNLKPQRGLVPLRENPSTGLWEFLHVRSGGPPWEVSVDTPLPEVAKAGLVFVLLPGGQARIGAQRTHPQGVRYDKYAWANEAPVRTLVLGNFFLSKYEVSRGQWARLGGTRTLPPSEGGPVVDAVQPIGAVSWHECRGLLARHGLTLPTEAQWEYACRAGTEEPWWPGSEQGALEEAMNVADEALRAKGGDPWHLDVWPGFDDGIQLLGPVHWKAPNAFGLFNVHGSVSEWCLDRLISYDVGEWRSTDGLHAGPGGETELGYVVRGGSFNKNVHEARSSRRIGADPNARAPELGVRPARAIQP